MKYATSKLLPILALSALALSACGNAKYQKQNYQATAVAGQYTKPKIDIVIFQDKSDSMRVPVQNMQGQLHSFLSGIDANWDYRFIVLPLQNTMSANGKYIVAQDCSSVTVGTCLSSSQISAFNAAGNDYGWITSIDSAIGNTDYGLQNMRANMQQTSMASFIRPDAALATIVLTNGEDVSGVSWADRGDGYQTIDYNSSTSQSSLAQYRSFFAGLKPSATLSKFYAVVASANYSNCWGGGAWQGKRYQDVANYAVGGGTLGRSYDICGSGLSNVLGDIKGQLYSLIQAIEFNHVVVTDRPMVSSIKITKNGVSIPQSNTNGWSYVGYQSNQPTSVSPAAGNYKTGYFIKLNGTARYKGTDVINVDYQKE